MRGRDPEGAAYLRQFPNDIISKFGAALGMDNYKHRGFLLYIAYLIDRYMQPGFPPGIGDIAIQATLPVFLQYKSSAGMYFDTVVFKNTRGAWKSDAGVNKPARRKIAAVLAHRTMRYGIMK
jgi:hypothetical protein